MTLTQRQRRDRLTRYTTRQKGMAWERDEGICRRCGRQGSDVHHAYGHATTWDEYGKTHEKYERADRLITLCWWCHQHCHHATPLTPKSQIIEILERVLEEAA